MMLVPRPRLLAGEGAAGGSPKSRPGRCPFSSTGQALRLSSFESQGLALTGYNSASAVDSLPRCAGSPVRTRRPRTTRYHPQPPYQRHQCLLLVRPRHAVLPHMPLIQTMGWVVCAHRRGTGCKTPPPPLPPHIALAGHETRATLQRCSCRPSGTKRQWGAPPPVCRCAACPLRWAL